MDASTGQPGPEDPSGAGGAVERDVPQRFRQLPPRVDPKDMITAQESEAQRDPEGGRDTDRDFMLRYGG